LDGQYHLKSLRDLDPQENKLASPSVTASAPAIFLHPAPIASPHY